MALHNHQQLLEFRSLEQRGTQLATIVSKCLAYNKVKNQMHQLTQVELTSLQRQQYLRTQIHSIQEELGESSQEDVDRLLKKANSKKWGTAIQELFRKEVTKLQRMNEQSPDYYVQYPGA